MTAPGNQFGFRGLFLHTFPVLYTGPQNAAPVLPKLCAGMDHTTYAHTGASVNIYAKGVGSEKFRGAFDNTEIYHKLAELTSVQ